MVFLIDSLEKISNNDSLFVSEGEEFITLPIPLSSKLGGGDWVTLNIGGKIFSTTKSTLTRDPNSMLARMFSNDWTSKRDQSGAYLIDRSFEYFSPILYYLRCGKLIINENLNPEGVLQEAKFYNISSLISQLQDIIDNRKRICDVTSRKDLCCTLLTSSTFSPLRCQGLNLEKVDLSRLDLSNINFKMTNLENATMEKANLDNASLGESNLSGANLQEASLRGANLARANLQNANLKGANFEDRGGLRANLEGANLKGAILEDCNFSGANLRAANLRGSTMENANLHRADLAGADLEGVNLKGANLNKANVNGANLHGANFDFRTVSSRQ
jgi:uncharacterized protein YjbI with pentapeptide repeats